MKSADKTKQTIQERHRHRTTRLLLPKNIIIFHKTISFYKSYKNINSFYASID